MAADKYLWLSYLDSSSHKGICNKKNNVNLLFHLQIPFEADLFRIERTGPSNEGDNVAFSCRLPAGQTLETDCIFITPNSKNLFTNKTGKTNFMDIQFSGPYVQIFFIIFLKCVFLYKLKYLSVVDNSVGRGLSFSHEGPRFKSRRRHLLISLLICDQIDCKTDEH
jgi:hypothetical protein